MRGVLIFSAFLYLNSFTGYSQTPDTLGALPRKAVSRFSASYYQLYKKRTVMINVFPTLVYLRNNENGLWQATVGFTAKAAYFPVDNVAIGLRGGMANTWTNADFFNREQMIGLFADYYFYHRKRLAVYTGVHSELLRFHYEPKVDWQFMNDPIDGQLRTHYIPTLGIPLGINAQLGKHITFYFAAGYKRALLNGRTGRVPGGSSILGDFGFNYYITPKPTKKDVGDTVPKQTR